MYLSDLVSGGIIALSGIYKQWANSPVLVEEHIAHVGVSFCEQGYKGSMDDVDKALGLPLGATARIVYKRTRIKVNEWKSWSTFIRQHDISSSAQLEQRVFDLTDQIVLEDPNVSGPEEVWIWP